MPRRRPGSLIQLEAEILDAGLRLTEGGDRFYGFLLAERLRDDAGGSRALIAHGTLYKALGRMLEAELLTAVWEDPDIAADEKRPRRKLYEVTPAGASALTAHRAGEVVSAPVLRHRPAGGLA